jgi:hypothetical protein
MAWFVGKMVLASTVISFCSWLSGRRPELAGYLVAMPLSSMLVLAFSYSEFQNATAVATLAKGILFAVPISTLFFLPFLLSDRWRLNFWLSFCLGIFLLTVGYAFHQWIMKFTAR